MLLGITKIIPFPAFATPRPHIFLWIATSIVETDAIAVNGAKTFLAKGKATFINGSANLPNKVPVIQPDVIILDNYALLSFISIQILF